EEHRQRRHSTIYTRAEAVHEGTAWRAAARGRAVEALRVPRVVLDLADVAQPRLSPRHALHLQALLEPALSGLVLRLPFQRRLIVGGRLIVAAQFAVGVAQGDPRGVEVRIEGEGLLAAPDVLSRDGPLGPPPEGVAHVGQA